MSLQEKIEKLINKINGLNGQILSLAKRVKELEEKPCLEQEGFIPDETFMNYLKGYMFGDTTPWIRIEAEPEPEEVEEIEEVQEDIESVDEEVLEKLDEVIEDA